MVRMYVVDCVYVCVCTRVRVLLCVDTVTASFQEHVSRCFVQEEQDPRCVLGRAYTLTMADNRAIRKPTGPMRRYPFTRKAHGYAYRRMAKPYGRPLPAFIRNNRDRVQAYIDKKRWKAERRWRREERERHAAMDRLYD